MTYRSNSVEPKWLLVGVFFVSGVFFGGLYVYLSDNAQSPSQVKIHPATQHFQYINPTLITEPAEDYNSFSTVSKDLDLRVNSIIDEAKKTGAVSDVGLYYRDLEPGTWLAVNANMQFSPGILLKLPIVIAYYKLAQQDPMALLDVVHYSGSNPIHHEDIFTGDNPLSPGQDYTVQYLLQKMIADSDENAAGLLFDHTDKAKLNEVFSDLGVDFNEDKTNRDFISIKRYSFFYRSLYNASYISPEYSERALALVASSSKLSLLQGNATHSTPYVSRLSGRVITISNKPLYEIYECDIVYYPGHPYLLCVVARGAEKGRISTLLGNIGSAIYSDTNYRYSSQN